MTPPSHHHRATTPLVLTDITLARRVIVLILAALTILALTASVTRATPGVIGEIGKGTIVNEGGVAVNQNTGDIYVADIEGQRILEYTPAGELILVIGKEVNQAKDTTPGASEEEQDICTPPETCTTGHAGNSNGQFSSPSGVAVDQGTGDLYIGDTGNDRVQKLTSTGHYISQIDSGTHGNPTFYLPEFSSNIAVDSQGDLLLLDLEENGKAVGEGHAIQFNPEGEYTGHNYGPLTLGEEKLTEPKGIAIDEDGYLYISRENLSVVQFSPEGQALTTLNGTAAGRAGVNPETGEVFVANPERKSEIAEYTRGGQHLESFGPLEGPVRGLAYDVSEGTLYVSDNASGSVLEFGPFPKPATRAPRVQRESLASLTQAATTLTAEVNPGGLETTYYFQYATNEALGGAQSTPPVPVGHGFGTIQASATIPVQPNTRYYYRVVAQNSYGAGSTIYGTIQGFASPAPPPTAATGPASEITQSTATLTGTVTPGSIGPSSQTEWCFQYGTNTIYNHGSLPIPAVSAGEGTSPTPVSTQLTGLWPNTLYHYRLLAINSLSLGSFGLGTPACGTAGGIATESIDATFITGSTPPPATTTGPATQITPTTATLAATLNDYDTPTTLEFDLGTDTTYGTRIFTNTTPSNQPQAITATIQELQPNTTYHYRTTATNPNGTTHSTDQTLTTPPIPTSLITPPTTSPLLTTPTLKFPTTQGKTPSTTPKHLTNAQKLARALKACRKKTKSKRKNCEKQAHKKYGSGHQASHRDSGQGRRKR